jgi:iron complex transport system substrate-binding protein
VPGVILRIVSLIASSTEIIHALGLGRYMVGRSHECDFPLTVKALPVCTAPKFNVEGTSYEIDQRVKGILEQSLSVYKVDAQILDELSPTHVITQAQCEVCAVSLKDVEEAACQMVKSQPRIISLEPNCLDDYFNDLLKVGRVLGAQEAAEELIDSDKRRIREVEKRATRADKKPTVAVIEWIEPLMAAGNWMPELVELAGGINLFGIAGKHSPWMKIEDLTRLDPDIIIVTPCGFDNQRTLEEMPALAKLEQFNQLKAAKSNRVYIADGNQYFNRPGPRLIDSLEIMAEILHPEIFPAAHGDAWLVYSPTSSGGN